MAILDLLWACPLCGIEGALHSTRRAELCQGCGTRYRRGRGATIVARQPGHPALTLSAAEWLDRLPPLDIEERIRRARTDNGLIHSEPALLRSEVGDQPVVYRGTYLNRIERLGPPRAGMLRLEIDRLSFYSDEQASGDSGSDNSGTGRNASLASSSEASDSMSPVHSAAATRTWTFDAITAVQPSSSTLQIGAGRRPLASFRVPGGSIRFWEELLCAALQRYYAAAGHGEIIEFQPRIVTR